MDGLAESGGHGGLADGLAEAGVRVAHTGKILRGGTVLEGDDSLSNGLTGVRANDVGSEKAVSLLAGKELDESLGLTDGACARVGHVVELALLVLNALCLELLLGGAHGSNLGASVDDAGHGIVVDVSCLTREDLSDSRAVVLSLVCKHGSLDDITSSVDGRDVGAEVVIDLNASSLVNSNAKLLEAETLGVRAASSGHKHNVGLDGLGVTTLAGLHGHLDAVVSHLSASHLGLELEVDALLLEGALEGLNELSVHAGAEGVHELNNGDLRSEAGPNRGHFETNDTTTNDDHLLGDGLKLEAASGVNDALLLVVHRAGGERGGLRSGGDDNVLGLDGLVAAVSECDGDLVGADDLTPALNVGGLVLLEETLNTAGETLNDITLLLHESVEADGDILDGDTVLGEVVLGHVVVVRGLEKSLGGNAAHVQAGATELSAALNTGGLEAELGSLDGAVVATGTTADEDHIEFLIRGGGEGANAANAEDAKAGGAGADGAAHARSCEHRDKERAGSGKRGQRKEHRVERSAIGFVAAVIIFFLLLLLTILLLFSFF